jgi:hypothetical protein
MASGRTFSLALDDVVDFVRFARAGATDKLKMDAAS